VSPDEESADELLGDGVSVEEAGEEPLAEEGHEEGRVPRGYGEEGGVRGEAEVTVGDWSEELVPQPFARRSCFFFSHEEHKLRPRQEKGWPPEALAPQRVISFNRRLFSTTRWPHGEVREWLNRAVSKTVVPN
jgi:hypothetical protein